MPKRALWVLCAMSVLLLSSVLLLTDGAPAAFAETTTKPARPRPDHGRARPAPITQAQEEELLAALEERMPQQHKGLLRMKEDQPRDYRRNLHRYWRWYQTWRDLPPKMQQIVIRRDIARLASFMLARAIRTATDPAKKERLTKQLAENVAKAFDAESESHAHKLGQLKDEIHRLEQELEQRTANRDQLIAEQVKRYLKARRRHSRRPATTQPSQ